ncbi:MAG: DUF6261 family protein [Breznakibacter sp.]
MKNKLTSLDLSSLTHLEAGELANRHLSDLGTIASQMQAETVYLNYLTNLQTAATGFQRALKKIQGNGATPKIVQADDGRDLSLRALRKAVSAATYSDSADEAEAAYQIKLVLKTYKNIELLGYEAESMAIDKLLAELDKGAYAQSIATLSLQRHLVRLRNANETFKNLFGDRMTTSAMQETFDARTLRHALQAVYREFALYVQAMANASQGGAYEQALNLINTARKYYADMLARRKGRAADKATTATA